MALTDCYLGSVNQWETDENDHLNVRFFVQKMGETLKLGMKDLSVNGGTLRVQHMRFLQEARIATPITGSIGVVSQEGEPLHVLTELRNTATGTVLASFVNEFDTATMAGADTIALPDHAGSRGVPIEEIPYARLSRMEALELGFVKTGRATVIPEECDETGHLLMHQYMGNISTSMPNLWARFSPPDDPILRGEKEGGAVLEYRMNYHFPLKLGDGFEVMSGLKAIGDKTQHMLHLMFSLENDQCVLGCEAVGVAMDLEKRKAKSIPDARRERMQQYLLPSID